MANLPPKKWQDVNTFADHKWVFLRSGTSERLLADNKCVWVGEPWTNHCGPDGHTAKRRLIVLTLPGMFSVNS